MRMQKEPDAKADYQQEKDTLTNLQNKGIDKIRREAYWKKVGEDFPRSRSLVRKKNDTK